LVNNSSAAQGQKGVAFQELDKERCDAAIKAVVEQTEAQAGAAEQWAMAVSKASRLSGFIVGFSLGS
jgi:hypothetical protein